VTRIPTPQTGRTITGPDDVDAHPQGDSIFGVSDLVGNVWQMTNVYSDEHTRYAVLRGGSYYHPTTPPNNNWYFPNFVDLFSHGKYLLSGDSYNRAATLGFRCVLDAIN